MKYTVIMTPTAKSDIVNLKSSLEQQIIDSSFIRKELKLIYQKISSLAIFPERYPILNNNTNYRKLSYKKYYENSCNWRRSSWNDVFDSI